jgi:hypothetical protein
MPRTYPALSREDFTDWLLAESVAAGDDVGDIARIYGVEPMTVARVAQMPDMRRLQLRMRQQKFEAWATGLSRGAA